MDDDRIAKQRTATVPGKLKFCDVHALVFVDLGLCYVPRSLFNVNVRPSQNMHFFLSRQPTEASRSDCQLPFGVGLMNPPLIELMITLSRAVCLSRAFNRFAAHLMRCGSRCFLGVFASILVSRRFEAFDVLLHLTGPFRTC